MGKEDINKMYLGKDYSKLVNALFSKKYSWFKKIDIDNVIYNKLKYKPSFLNLKGTIYVDSDWGHKQFREYYYDLAFPEDTELSFGDIMGGDLSKEIQDDFKTIFSSLYGTQIPTYMSFTWLMVKFVDEDKRLEETIKKVLRKENKYSKNMKSDRPETNESELTEKCWPGYTQKGMKTMFGKRYPNCVKKKKTLKEWYVTRDREKEMGMSYVKFEEIINNLMGKRYDWWEGIKIKDILYSGFSDEVEIYGVLNVNRKWAKQQLKKLRPFFKTKDGEGLDIDDVFNMELMREIEEYLTMLFSTLTNFNKTEGVRLNALHIKFA